MSPTPIRSLVLLALVSALAAPAATQTASYTSYGQSCGHPSLAPSLSVLSPPKAGQTFTVVYNGRVGGAFIGSRTFRYTPLLITGVSNRFSGTLALPFAIPTAVTGGVTGCFLLASTETVIVMTPWPFGPDEARVTLSVPSSPWLLGMDFYQQCVTFTETRNAGQLVSRTFLFSNGGHGRIGL